MGLQQCLNSTGDRQSLTQACKMQTSPRSLWECLRRNVDYQREHRAMVANSPDGEVTPEFRRRCGVCFRA
ncbi:DUF6499 domain-containing protein [Bradyrhizobium sp. CB1650]|uniref:transcriptional regulator domain-containing protein n=1 Tax=Bradyrhizobium sp. CB1650 TaxID=3039153 RepID=UPI00325FBE60